ncbi:hypothetical protein [Clostridium sp. SGI.024]|uniref:hypothetical protein n=1 Tax=Clostridium sp. SGI.024 TaxID=3420551 RepID=UPI003D05DDAD
MVLQKSFYNYWKFSEDPFSYRPLGGDEVGQNLLVGRNDEKKAIKTRLRKTDKICTVEGDTGIGKTSLVNVSIFECYEEWNNNKELPLLIPCISEFQLKEDLEIDILRNEILIKLAKTIIKYKEVLKSQNCYFADEIEELFEYKQNEGASVGFSLFGFGINGGVNKAINKSKIFEKELVFNIIEEVLSKTFENLDGGIVCLIDNIELVNSNRKAKELIELMRDRIFNIQGTKWILCGEKDIFMSSVESSRMSAYIHRPILVNKLDYRIAKDMFRNRFNYYGGVYLPLTESEFESLFKLFEGNTRDIFQCVGDYCLEVYESGDEPTYEYEKEDCFTRWLESFTIKYIKNTINVIQGNNFKNIFNLYKSNIFNINEFKRRYNDNNMDSFIKLLIDNNFIKVYEDNTFTYLRKGHIMNYYLSTFDSFDELKEELEITFEIFGV